MGDSERGVDPVVLRRTRAGQASPTLGEAVHLAADELNGELDEVERYLEGLGLGVRAAVRFPSGGILAYGKRGHAWRLLLVAPDGGESPLHEVSLGKRVEAVALLPELLEALRSAALVRVEEVQAATARLRAFRGAP